MLRVSLCTRVDSTCGRGGKEGEGREGRGGRGKYATPRPPHTSSSYVKKEHFADCTVRRAVWRQRPTTEGVVGFNLQIGHLSNCFGTFIVQWGTSVKMQRRGHNLAGYTVG